METLPEGGLPWNPHAMWCPWCGERIILGVLTPGGIVYHAACWRRRGEMLRSLPLMSHACTRRTTGEGRDGTVPSRHRSVLYLDRPPGTEVGANPYGPGK